MIRKLFIGGVLMLTGCTAAIAAAETDSGIDSGVNGRDAAGCLSRSAMLLDQHNYSGCIDQLSRLEMLHPDAAQQRKAMSLKIKAMMGEGSDEALELIDKYISLYPTAADVAEMKVLAGDYWFERMTFALAMDRYSEVSSDMFDSSLGERLTYRTAYCAMMLGNTRRAEAGFRSVASTRTYGNAARFYLGYLAYESGDYNKALEYFRQTDPNRDPSDKVGYYMSQIYFMKGDYRQALESARNILRTERTGEFAAEANRVAGESLYKLGRESEAIPYLNTYMGLTDNPLPSALYILGVNAFRNYDYEDAVSYLRGATVTDDAMGQSAWLYLGQSYVHTDRLSSALMAFEKAYQRKFDKDVAETAFYNYAVARLEGGRVPFGSSVTLFQEFLQEYPDSRYASKVQEYIVNGYLADNDYKSVLESVSRMSHPTSATLAAKQRALFMLGTQSLASGNASAARQYLLDARAIKSSPEIGTQCDLWLGDCYYAMGQYANAVKSYRAFLGATSSRDVNYATACYDLGYAYYASEEYAQALKSFRQALGATRNPLSVRSQADATNRVADCLYYQHKFSEAATEYRRAYDIDPSAGDYALYQLAVMKGLERDYNAKITALDDLIARFPSSVLAPAALLAKGESYSALERPADAISTYREVTVAYPSSAYARKAQLQMAIAMLASSRKSEAVDTYKDIIKRYPSSEEARVATDDLKRIYAEDGSLNAFASFLASVPDAPQLDPSEMDVLAFRAAEKEYLDSDNATRIASYLKEFPSGTYRPQALYYMAEGLSDSGRAEEAYGYVTELVSRYPEADVIEDAMLIKASIESSRGQHEVALDTYTALESIASSPRNLAEARLGIVRTALGLERYTAVIEASDRVLSSTASVNNESEIRYSRAVALDATGRHDEAYDEWRVLASRPSQLYGAASAVSLANSLLQRGNIKEARKVIDTFLDAETPHQYWQARGFIVLSDILRRQNQEFEADEYLRTLRTNYPGSEQDIIEMIDSRLK